MKFMVTYVLCTGDKKLVDSLSKSSMCVNYPCIRWLKVSFFIYNSIEFTPECNSSIACVPSSSDILMIVKHPCAAH